MKKATQLIIGCLFIMNGALLSQDGHYWSEQYGTKSMLLGGSVIGSVEDLGAVFYNPSRLGVIENPTFLISAKVYQLQNLRIEDALGNNKDLKSKDFGGAPSLVAGTFSINWLPTHQFAYAFLTREYIDNSFTTRESTTGDIFPGLFGEELFEGNITVGKVIKEEWIGVSWAHAPSSRLSFGLSGFFTNLRQSEISETHLYLLDAQNQVSTLTQINNYSFKHYGIIWKAGVSLDFDAFRAGVTITAPKLELKGDGSTTYEQIYTGLASDIENNNKYTTNYQSGLEAKHQSPWSFGFGAGYTLKKLTIHASAEYYTAVDRHTQLQTTLFESQSSGETLQNTLYSERTSVFNYGVGLELLLSEGLSGYGSIAIDNSAFVPQSNIVDKGTKMTHWAGGILLKTKFADITAGATYAAMNRNLKRPLNFPQKSGDIVFDDNQFATAHWSRWRFIVGISIPFLEEKAKELEKKLLSQH